MWASSNGWSFRQKQLCRDISACLRELLRFRRCGHRQTFSAARQEWAVSVAELSTESQKWGCLSSVATDPSLSLEEWGADSLSPRCPPWPFTPLLLQQLWHMYSPAERFPGPEAPRSDGLSDAWPPVPRRSNRSQLSLGAERARAERPGSQETRIQGLGAARISHGTLDKLVSLSRASVS